MNWLNYVFTLVAVVIVLSAIVAAIEEARRP